MKTQGFWRGALLALGWAMATLAQAQISEGQAEQLMRLSGQWAQIESMATQMQEGLVQGLSAATSPPRPNWCNA